MQVGGDGRRISADRLRLAIQGESLDEKRVSQFRLRPHAQISSTALSNGTSSIEERLAR